MRSGDMGARRFSLRGTMTGRLSCGSLCPIGATLGPKELLHQNDHQYRSRRSPPLIYNIDDF